MEKRRFDISSAGLHIFAMLCMLLDHMWATVIPGNTWMTCVGRIAFPIFAFMIAEGCHYTHNMKKYMLRMLGFAIVSEIPFDLMVSGLKFYPYHQNVMWTFFIAMVCIYAVESVKKLNKTWLTVPVYTLTVIFGAIIGFVTFVDYYGAGVLTVLVFYFFRERKPVNVIIQFALLWWLNVEVLGGYYFNVEILGHSFEIVQQGFALLAFIPILLYRGRQGLHTKGFQYFCYAFYPMHCLILWLPMQI